MSVDPPRAVLQDLVPATLQCERKPTLTLPEDPAAVIRKKLSALDCPAKKGWKMNSSIDASVLCKCGGGSHQLSVAEVVAQISPLGFDADVFRHYVEQKRRQFEGQDVNSFLKSFLDTDGHDVLARCLAERQKVHDQIELEKSSFQRLLECKDDLMQQQRQICEGYRADFHEGQVQSERVYVKYCHTSATSVPGAEVNIDPETTSVDDALRELNKAKQLNESRVQVWADWEEGIAGWEDVPEVFQHRPDLQDANFDKDDSEAKAAQLKKQADMILRKMSGCLPDRATYSSRLLRIQEEWAHHVEEYQKGEGRANG